MDFFSVLEEAQQGNYKSYELLTQQIQQNPLILNELVSYLANDCNSLNNRELVGIYIKNLFLDPIIGNWLKGFEGKLELIEKILNINGLDRTTSLILTSAIELDSKSENSKVLQFLLNFVKTPSIMSIGYYIENSRTIPELLSNKLISLILSTLNTNPLLGLKFFSQSAKHIPLSHPVFGLLEKIIQYTNFEDLNIVKESFNCLVEIASNLYDFLQPFIEKIVEITVKGLDFDEENINFLSLEFWNVVVDIEKLRNDEKIQNFEFVKKYAENIFAVLMRKIANTEENEKIYHFCGVLEGISDILQEKSLQILSVLANQIVSEDYKQRACGFYVFGSILEGFSKTNLENLSEDIITAINKGIKDSNLHVVQSTIWFIFKLSEVYPEICQKYPILLEILYKCLLEKNWSTKFALDSLLEIVDSGVLLPNTKELVSSLLSLGTFSKFFHTFNLIRSIFEHSANDDPVVLYYFPIILSNLSAKNLQFFSSILRICFERVSFDNIAPYYSKIFLLLETLPFNEEILIAVSYLSKYSLFLSFLPVFTNFLALAFENKESCDSAVISLGELARNLNSFEAFASFIEKVCEGFDYSRPNTLILETLTDVCSLHAIVVLPFLPKIVSYLEACMEFSLSDKDDSENLEELKEMTVFLIEGLIQGLEGLHELQRISENIDKIVKYCLVVCQDQFCPSQSLVGSVFGIFSDVLMGFQRIPYEFDVKNLISKYINSEIEIVKMNAQCALSNILL